VWCEGAFHGQVTEISRPLCEPVRGEAVVCPMFIVFDGRVGTFTFRVRAPRPSAAGVDRTAATAPRH
jgi:hypothetical protein